MNFFLSLLRCDLVSSLTILRSLPFDLLIISTSFTISHLFEMMVNLVFDVRWRLPCALPLQSFSKNAFMILGDRDSKIDQHLPPLIPGAYSVIPNYSFFLPMLALKSLIIIVKWDFSLLLAKGTSSQKLFLHRLAAGWDIDEQSLCCTYCLFSSSPKPLFRLQYGSLPYYFLSIYVLIYLFLPTTLGFTSATENVPIIQYFLFFA